MRCTLNGIHVDAVGPVGWAFITGYQPHVQGFELDKGEAAGLLKSGQAATLVIEDGGQTLTVNKLSIIGEAASSAPMFRTVLVADLRWKWSRAHILGRYNIRRRTGQKTLLNEGLIELAQTIDKFKFAAWSLRGEQKWRPKEMVEDVLAKLKRSGQFEHEFRGQLSDELEVNDVDIDDPGPEGIALAMKHLPGAALWVDKEGKVIIQSAIDLSEGGVIQSAGPEIVDGGHASKISFGPTRPGKIVVYFTKEQEIRFDSIDEGTDRVDDDTRNMENVVVVTDPAVTIAGAQVNVGSWVPFDSIFTYWNSTKEIAGAFDITHDFIQATFFEDNLFNVHVPWGDDNPQPIWLGRIAAIKAHYRTTYKINSRWVDRTYTILPVRAAILDQATGTRGRAQAFTDYCVKLSSRSIVKDPGKQQLYKNVEGYDPDAVAQAAGQKGAPQVSPALVEVLDDQAGIIHLDYKVDLYGFVKEIYPSRMDNIPTANIGDKNTRGLGIKVGRFGNFPRLASDHKCAVVLTIIPAAPNDTNQFYKVEVKPEDVKPLVPGLVIEPAQGPTWYIRVHPGLVTARIAWRDNDKDAIERTLGVNLPDPQTPEQRAAADEQANEDQNILKNLIVNHEDLDAVAKAVAAQVWSRLSDRYMGEKSVRNLDVELKGAMNSLRYTIETDGKVIGHITLPEQLPERNVLALLPEGTRRTILREVPN